MPWAVAASVGGAVVSSALADDYGAEGANNAAADATRQQAEIAKDQWNTYKETYQPLEKQLVESAQNYGSIANKNKAATQAAADVTSSFAGLRERLTKSPGINVNSQAYLNTMANTGLAEAAQKAAAETGARDKVQQMSDAKLTDAVSLGKGLAATASSGLASASSQFGGMAQRGMAQQNQEAQQIGSTVGGIFSNKNFQDWAGKTWSGATATPAASSAIDYSTIGSTPQAGF